MGKPSIDRILGWLAKTPDKPLTALPGAVDSATGLPARAALIAEVEQVLIRGRRKRSTSLMIFDFTDIQGPNLTHDRLIPELARLLRMWIPPVHMVGRMREREFAVLISDGLPLGEVERLADHVIGRLRTTQALHEYQKAIVTVVGVAFSSKSICSPSELLRNADIALSRAKAMGRGWYLVVDHVPMEQAA